MNKRGLIVIIIAVLILLAIFYSIFNTKNCENVGCFEEAAVKCKKATIQVKEGNSISRYTIKGEEKGNCILKIKIEKMSASSQEIKQKFEEKSMLCEIPTNEFSRMKIEDMGANLDLCHGPLKEEMYDVVIKKLYNLVVRDMSSILEEVESVL